jgi:hypothetical protein
MYRFNRADGAILDAADCYTFRLRVDNKGRDRAERVQVYAAELYQRNASGQYLRVPNFLPLNLQWAHSSQDKPEVFADVINPKMMRHCNLAHIIHPKYNEAFGHTRDEVDSSETTFVLYVEAEPNSKCHLLSRGEYRLELLIAASNALPKKTVLNIHLSGQWFDDANRMLSTGIGITAS